LIRLIKGLPLKGIHPLFAQSSSSI